MGIGVMASVIQPTRSGRLMDFCLRAGRVRILAGASLLIAAIAVADWYVGLDVSLGVFYIFPIVLGSLVLRPSRIVALAIFCSFLRWLFGNAPSQFEALLRFLFSTVSYMGCGLFISAVIRNHEATVRHFREIEEQQALRRMAEEHLRVLVESSPAAIVTLNGAGRVLAANKAADNIFGIESGQSLEGRSIDGYLPVLADALRMTQGAEPFRTAAQCQGRRDNGEIFLAHTWFSTYRTADDIRLAAIVVDSSEEMRQREEQNLQQLLRSNRVTAAAVSHEVRNLCAAMSLIFPNVRQKYALADDRDFDALTSLADALEQIASLELQSRTQESLEEVQLRSVLDNLRIVIEPNWEDIDGVIHWDLPVEQAVVLAEPNGLLQAFLNLAQNSHRAVQDGERRELSISCCVRQRKVIVRFHDTGPGVAEPSRLFQPFQKGAGTGMGLYVSRAILRSYGGELRYEPQTAGACFAVELQAVQTGA